MSQQVQVKLNKGTVELSFWLDANKIALDVDKTGAVFFKTKYKILDTEVTLHKLRAKQLHLSKSIKIVEIDENVDWKDHGNDIASRLIRINPIITKLRYYVHFSIGCSHI